MAIKQLIEDTQELINDKMETLSRLVSILQFLEKIKHEVDTLVLCTVRETVEKSRIKLFWNQENVHQLIMIV